MQLHPPVTSVKKVMFFSVCLSVCLSAELEMLWTNVDDILECTNSTSWLDFDGDPDGDPDPGILTEFLTQYHCVVGDRCKNSMGPAA